MMRRPPSRFAPWVLLCGLGAAQAAHGLELRRITPAGNDVDAGQQITLSFDRDVVPLGRMERTADEIPVTITPAVPCEWRWLDPKVLACQLPRDARLLEATRYTVELDAGLKAEDGTRLARSVTHQFITARPTVRYTTSGGWASPTQPVLQLRFSQPVTAASVAASLRFDDVAVKVEPKLFDARTPFYTPDGEAREQWSVYPEIPLQADRDYALRVLPGLRSAFGTEKGIENRRITSLHSFPAFRWRGFSCTVDGGFRRFGPEDSQSACEPLSPIRLEFSSPVAPAAVGAAITVSPDPLTGRGDFDAWAAAAEQVDLRRSNRADETYTVTLPYPWKAATHYRITLDATLEDGFGRPLAAPVELRLQTGHRDPALHLQHPQAVVEQGIDSELPLVVTNLDRIDIRYDRLTVQGLDSAQSAQRVIDGPRDIAYAVEAGVRDLLAGRSGAVRGSLRTRPQTTPPDRDAPEFFAEVTPWQVHLKLGHDNSLAWVSDLQTGAPVVDAKVEIYAAVLARLAPAADSAPASAQTDDQGLAWLPGTRELDPELEHLGWSAEAPLMARVTRGEDIAVLPLDYDFQVDVYRASNYEISSWQRRRNGHLRAWGTTAQGVYRAGDRIQYKLYVRDAAGSGLSAAPEMRYALRVFDPTNSVVHERDTVTLDAYGAVHGEFKLPPQAVVGWYRFELEVGEGDATETLQPLRVLVSDFTPASYHVSTELAAASAKPQQTLEARLSASLHGGGPYGEAPARITARITPQTFEPRTPQTFGFQFDSDDGAARDVIVLPAREGRTDVNGAYATSLDVPDGGIAYGRLITEASVRDDRGRSIASTASIPYTARDRLIGLRYRGWLLDAGKPASVDWLVVDAAGQPAAGSPSYIKVEREQTGVARVLGPGNAYLPQYTREWIEVAVCKGRSAATASRCGFTPDQAGSYRITAMVRDTEDRLQQTRLYLYARGPQFVVWEDRPDLSLELSPEQASNAVGDTARYLVKNPYPGAQALVSVERYGVLDAWVETLEGNTPVVEIPVKPDYLPGAYVSVVVLSPRAAPPPKDGPDLGKPTFRMGYAQLPVADPYKRIDVKVTPQAERYRPGDRVNVSLAARPHQVGAALAPVQYAVAVLDDAVFDLIQDGEDYFDPYDGLLQLDPLDLNNYGLLTRLIGRQKIEKKGASPGGDGGAALSLRSVEKFVAYWNPALDADAQGQAQFEFKAPDNLTNWRVLALAVTAQDRLGLGSGKLAVSKDIELRPAMPNQVLGGDRFRAGFTVLNRTQATREVPVTIRASGAAQAQTQETVSLAPFERRTVYLNVATDTDDNRAGTITFEAQAGSGEDGDALRHSVAVKPRRATATAADYGLLEAGSTEVPLQTPAPILGGEFSLQLSPSVLGNVDGAFEYVRDYPYLCWEQRITKAVMAAQYLRLKPYLDFEWPQAEQLIRDTLDNAASFQTGDGGMAFWVPETRYESPYLSAYTLLAFGWLKQAGFEAPATVRDKLIDYNQSLLKKDFGYGSLDARSTVRAVSLLGLKGFDRLSAADVTRFEPQLPRMNLFGQALMLQAATGLSAPTAQRARELLLSHADESAGGLWLRAEQPAWAVHLLGTDTRSNCAALSALVGSESADSELPFKLARAVTQARKRSTHWYNTQENVWCSNALADYAERHEAGPLALDIVARLGDTDLGTARLDDRKAPPTLLRAPLEASDEPHRRDLNIDASGEGRAYFAARMRYVEPDEAVKRRNAGFEIRRQYARRDGDDWVVMQPPYQLNRGDLVRVTVKVSVPATRFFVVVDDPVPGGIEPVNTQLATASTEDARSEERNGYPYPFYHRELRFDAVRHYADTLTAGSYQLQWTGQAVAEGDFAVAPPHVEAMYDPDVFGADVGARMTVGAGAP